MKLYEIPAAIRDALDAFEVDEETGEILNAPDLEALEGEASRKIESACLYVRELAADVAAIKAEADRMTERRRSLEKKAERIKALILPALEAVGGKVKGTMLSASVATTKSVELDEDALNILPEEFVRVKREADKTAIKAALSSGQVIEGARIVENKSIRMR